MKVCFFGLGSIGKRHMMNLSKVYCEKENLEIHAYRSTSRELSHEINELISKEIQCENDLEEYDIIFITNPTVQHYKTLKKFGKFGKNFFIEKPIFHTNKLSLEDLKTTKDKNYYVACPLRHSKVLLEVKNIIQDLDVYSIRAISSSYLPSWRQEIDYRNNYSASKDLGGGVTNDLIHELDYIIDFFGFPKVMMNISGKFSHLEIDSDDLSIYIGKYKDKLCEIHLDYIGRPSQRRLELITDEGTYTIDLLTGDIIKPNNEKESHYEERNQMYLREMRYFLDMINGKKRNINSINHAFKVLKIAKGEEIK